MTFEEFAAARLSVLLRFATVLAGERALAEDVVQEVLVRAHARWRRIGTLEQPEMYVRRMITNEYLSWRRRWARIIPVGSVGLPVSDAPDHATTHADQDALRTELAGLPKRQRAVLVLRYYEGLSDTEIAGVLDCSPGTVRGYASRALATLRVASYSDALKETR
ncbi:RNA polymerase subunit sigma-24 [Longispora fulva]|uniref:RNA polymerase sigma-70 factor (Sigma-E family) n=1 Tax=Longispora fulva TaxID=619741 RepID=A0A8J7GFW0_9ACTN|nr:SigE family RNA polymerase sigma factor [Longispora fulva]MBG6136625.1 RNA polymerase sigma-70 factor (sigma-E family) [Longispora fulva]GIG59794.1 RNA polymerase subunit sigma-24 [Longispora fulva]